MRSSLSLTLSLPPKPNLTLTLQVEGHEELTKLLWKRVAMPVPARASHNGHSL